MQDAQEVGEGVLAACGAGGFVVVCDGDAGEVLVECFRGGHDSIFAAQLVETVQLGGYGSAFMETSVA